MTDLPPTGAQKARYLMVITDRLSKMVVPLATPSMDTRMCAETFLHNWVGHHAFPRSIISDRGSNWVSAFWKRLCELTGVQQRLSTGYHPQTDGSTERANQEVQAYLRAYATYTQEDWGSLLPVAMLAINNRDTKPTGMNPFFITHGYHVDAIQLHDITDPSPENSQRGQAEAFIRKLQETTEFVQAAIAAGQHRMEETANQRRSAAEQFQVGDRVWLNLRNIKTQRSSKKLDWLHAKYRVTRVINSHAVELDVPGHIYPHFHVDLLQRAATDPLPSQKSDDTRPPPIIPEDSEDDNNEPEWNIEKIISTRLHRRRHEALVKWTGYTQPTWEPLINLQDTIALEEFESRNNNTIPTLKQYRKKKKGE
jgi:hypothetical protein